MKTLSPILCLIFGIHSIQGQMVNWTFYTEQNQSSEVLIEGSAAGSYLFTDFEGQCTYFFNGQEVPVSANGESDLFLGLVNEQDELIWHYSFGGSGNIQADQILVSNSGDLFLMGSFFDSFDPGIVEEEEILIAQEFADFFIAKYNQDLELQWINQYEGIGAMDLAEAIIKSDNNLVVCSRVTATIDVDHTEEEEILNTGIGDGVLVFELDGGNGDLLWHEHSGDVDGAFFPKSMDIIEGEGIYIVGDYTNQVDFDFSENVVMLPSAYESGFILKLSEVGEYVTVKGINQLSDGDFDLDHIVHYSGNGIIAVGGTSENDIDSDPSDEEQILEVLTEDPFLVSFTTDLEYVNSLVFNVSENGGKLEDLTTNEFFGFQALISTAGPIDISFGQGDLYTPEGNAHTVMFEVEPMLSTLGGIREFQSSFLSNGFELDVFGDWVVSGSYLQDIDLDPFNEGDYLMGEGMTWVAELNVVSSIEEKGIEDLLEVFPVPTEDLLQLRSVEIMESIVIFDLQGRRIHIEEELSKKELTIQVSDWPTGVYQLKVLTESGEISKRVIVR